MYRPGSPFSKSFFTYKVDALENASPTPTGILRKNGVDTAVAVTIDNNGTGSYVASGVIPASYMPGDVIELIIDATVNLIFQRKAFDLGPLDGTPVSGSGADRVTISILVAPIADADVWVTSDLSGTLVVAGTQQTNSVGQTVFLLNAGVTYYLWMQKDGVNPIQGQSFVAVAG